MTQFQAIFVLNSKYSGSLKRKSSLHSKKLNHETLYCSIRLLCTCCCAVVAVHLLRKPLFGVGRFENPTGDDVEGAIRWSNYGSASFIVSCFATAIGSWLMPWFKSWERVAFTVSVTLGYALLAWFVTIFIVLIA